MLLEAENRARELALRERELDVRPRASDLQVNNQSSTSSFGTIENIRTTTTTKSFYDSLIDNQAFRAKLGEPTLELIDTFKEWFNEGKELPNQLNSRGGEAWTAWVGDLLWGWENIYPH